MVQNVPVAAVAAVPSLHLAPFVSAEPTVAAATRTAASAAESFDPGSAFVQLARRCLLSTQPTVPVAKTQPCPLVVEASCRSRLFVSLTVAGENHPAAAPGLGRFDVWIPPVAAFGAVAAFEAAAYKESFRAVGLSEDEAAAPFQAAEVSSDEPVVASLPAAGPLEDEAAAVVASSFQAAVASSFRAAASSFQDAVVAASFQPAGLPPEDEKQSALSPALLRYEPNLPEPLSAISSQSSLVPLVPVMEPVDLSRNLESLKQSAGELRAPGKACWVQRKHCAALQAGN